MLLISDIILFETIFQAISKPINHAHVSSYIISFLNKNQVKMVWITDETGVALSGKCSCAYEYVVAMVNKSENKDGD